MMILQNIGGGKMFNKKDRCYNGGKQHKFTPRYDEIPHSTPTKISGTGVDIEKLRRMFITEIYVKDVCEWCGKEIKR